MSVNQQHLVEILRGQVGALEERTPNYRRELLDTLAEIIVLERTNRIRRIAIQQDVRAKCEALGTFLSRGQQAR